MADLALKLLGPVEVTVDAQPVTKFRTRAAAALLFLLVCEESQSLGRERLMDLLWPGMTQSAAQANLRQTVYRLKKQIPEVTAIDGNGSVPLIVSERRAIGINPAAKVELDLGQFTAALDHQPEQAFDLYRGDFLADFYLPDSETFAAWMTARRETYRRQLLQALEQTVADQLNDGEFASAISLAERQLDIDNLRENSHRQLIEAYARSGRRQDALNQFATLRDLLRTELDLNPEPETITLIESIRAGQLSRTIAESSPTPIVVGGLARPKHNLPYRLTPIIGREREIETLKDQVRAHRLVMVAGVGGVGKTTLSIAVGHQLVDEFEDGVWLIELAPVQDEAFVAQAAVYDLALGESGMISAQERVINFLVEKRCLIVLDNCEHVVDAAAELSGRILRSCPQVKILANSREIFDLPGEVLFSVPSLSLPEPGQTVKLANWADYEALSLFVTRAQTVVPDFEVRQDNLGDIVDICRQLDGTPLALELAAARTKMLSTAEIAARLDNRFRLLTKGNRDSLSRHHTLRALVTWSWDLLSDAERLLLARLSVFAGGMSLEAAEAVCFAGELDADDALDLLSDLVNKSLLVNRREAGQESRYFLLETIRQYAAEQLPKLDDVDRTRDLHLGYFYNLSLRAEAQLEGPNQATWFDRLEIEFDNIRAALTRALDTDCNIGVEMLDALNVFIWARAYSLESYEWLRRILDTCESLSVLNEARAFSLMASVQYFIDGYLESPLPLAERAVSLYAQTDDRVGRLKANRLLAVCMLNGDQFLEGYRLLEACLAEAQERNEPLIVAEVKTWLGYFARHREADGARSRQLLEESEAFFRRSEDHLRLAGVLDFAGQIAIWKGDYDAARSKLEESIAIHDEIGFRGSSYCIHLLGQLYLQTGQYQQARTLLQRALAASRQINDLMPATWTVIRLGYVCLRSGDLGDAREQFVQGIKLFSGEDVSSTYGLIYALEGVASLAVVREEPEEAVKLLAWADEQRRVLVNQRPVVEQADVDQDLARIREMLAEGEMTLAYEAGRQMSKQEAINCALNLLNE